MKKLILLFLLKIIVFSTVYSQTAEEYIEQGIQKADNEYVKYKTYKEAYDLFNKAIELDPNNAKAYYNRGLANYNFIRRGQYIQEKGEDPTSFDNNYYKPISDFTKAIEINPNYAKAYYNRGVIYKYLEEYLKAIADFTKYINLEKDDKNGYESRAKAYFERKDYSKSISDFTKVINIDKKDDYTLYNRGLAYYFLGKEKEARQDWSNVSSYMGIETHEMLSSFKSYKPTFMKDVNPNEPITFKYFIIMANKDDDSVFINVQKEMNINPILTSYDLVVNLLDEDIKEHYVSIGSGEDAVKAPFNSLSKDTQQMLKGWCAVNKCNLLDIFFRDTQMKSFDR